MSLFERLAGAPISWGVCEVPGWGSKLRPERVLAEMKEIGLLATELGPAGYLPTDAGELRQLVAKYDLAMIGGFVPLVLHDPAQRAASIATTHRVAALMGGAGATEFVTSMVASSAWEPRFELDNAGWAHAADVINQIEDIVGGYGMHQALHPHLGTMIERPEDVKQLLDRSDVGWCLDTGHLLIGGYDPLEFLSDARDRIRHVHLKDTHLDRARRVLSGEQSLMEGVQNDMFCAMGRGDVPIGEIVTRLEMSGYDRWYVLEQDVALTSGPPPEGQGPKIDVLQSVDFLRGVDAALRVDSDA